MVLVSVRGQDIVAGAVTGPRAGIVVVTRQGGGNCFQPDARRLYRSHIALAADVGPEDAAQDVPAVGGHPDGETEGMRRPVPVFFGASSGVVSYHIRDRDVIRGAAVHQALAERCLLPEEVLTRAAGYPHRLAAARGYQVDLV